MSQFDPHNLYNKTTKNTHTGQILQAKPSHRHLLIRSKQDEEDVKRYFKGLGFHIVPTVTGPALVSPTNFLAYNVQLQQLLTVEYDANTNTANCFFSPNLFLEIYRLHMSSFGNFCSQINLINPNINGKYFQLRYTVTNLTFYLYYAPVRGARLSCDINWTTDLYSQPQTYLSLSDRTDDLTDLHYVAINSFYPSWSEDHELIITNFDGETYRFDQFSSSQSNIHEISSYTQLIDTDLFEQFLSGTLRLADSPHFANFLFTNFQNTISHVVTAPTEIRCLASINLELQLLTPQMTSDSVILSPEI